MSIYSCYNFGMSFEPEKWQRFIKSAYKRFYMQADDRPSLSAFARKFGISPQLVSNWDLGKFKDRPRMEQYSKFIPAFGREVYEALDLPIPPAYSYDPMAAFTPASLYDSVKEARAEYMSELESKGITEDSPEARDIVIKAFTKRGLKVTISE